MATQLDEDQLKALIYDYMVDHSDNVDIYEYIKWQNITIENEARVIKLYIQLRQVMTNI
jgi:hypothetical protein